MCMAKYNYGRASFGWVHAFTWCVCMHVQADAFLLLRPANSLSDCSGSSRGVHGCGRAEDIALVCKESVVLANLKLSCKALLSELRTCSVTRRPRCSLCGHGAVPR